MNRSMLHICVAGGGSWGTALAHLAAQCGHRVTLFVRSADVAKEINQNHENPKYLKGYALAPSIIATTDPSALDTSFVIMAIPFQAQREFLKKNHSCFKSGSIIVNVAKGIELSTLKTGEIIAKETLDGVNIQYAVLSGPSFAKEVLMGMPTAVVVASRTPGVTQTVAENLSNSTFRCYGANDVLGVEIGGAVKNVIAIAAGLCDGLNRGTNGRAALLTRGLAEMKRLGMALGASPLTFMGLSGLGDLVLTATGDLSRNRQLGLSLGRGKEIDEARQEIGMVTEGVKTAFAVRNLAKKLEIEVPITEAVCAILEGKLSPAVAAEQLMLRTLRFQE